MFDATNTSVILATTPGSSARLRFVAVGAVQLGGNFWADRRRVNREVTLPTQYQQLDETGRIDNFRRAAEVQPDRPHRGAVYNDSDVYKWVEAAAWTLAAAEDRQLEQLLDRLIDDIAGAQQPDGYLNTYFMFEHAAERWTNFDAHEMYCAGHLIQAAVAVYRSTGKRQLLDVAVRLADYLDRTFGPEQQGKRVFADGHEEIEMALVELARATGQQRYLDLARFFVEVRGSGRLKHPRVHFDSMYYQDHTPFAKLDAVVGHAVRALYYACGVADICLEHDDPMLRGALDRQWQNMTTRRMYVTGGLGARYDGESFGADYELTNERAYTETCAAIGSVMWNQRMLALTGAARYADLLEHTLFNAVLPGIALDGQTYFYQNPLADAGGHRRQRWFGTACCPPNVARLLAALPGYIYSTSDDTIWVHLYAESSATATLANGQQIRLEQHTSYPWSGDVSIRIRDSAEFGLRLRVPGWCAGAQLWINGERWTGELTPGEYVQLRRAWQAGDRVQLQLPMPVRMVRSHPYIAENNGRVALMRGPLLYCVESADHPNVDLRDLVVDPDAPPQAEERADMLGGIVVLRGSAKLRAPDAGWQHQLYRSDAQHQGADDKLTPLVAIPYYAWANRAPGRMLVWMRAT